MPLPDLTSAPTDVVNQAMKGLNKGRVQPLTRFQEKQIKESKPVYIYNVSSIHRWERFQGQLGTVVLPKCEEGDRVSKPYIVKGVIARWYDKGLGRKEAFLEEGIEVAEDICGCSREYPVESLNNNLTTYGVFITRAPLEDLPKKEQDRLIEEAMDKYVEKLRDLILAADGFHAGDDMSKKRVGQIHREALKALNQLEGTQLDRPWAPIRYSAKSVDCEYCGASNKPNVALCANCHKVINLELYEALEKKNKSKAKD